MRPPDVTWKSFWLCLEGPLWVVRQQIQNSGGPTLRVQNLRITRTHCTLVLVRFKSCRPQFYWESWELQWN